MYRRLNAESIIETADRLAVRIGERFPGTGLAGVAGELVDVARQSRDHAAELAKPNWRLRIGVVGVLVLALAVLALVVRDLKFGEVSNEVLNLITVLEPAANIAVLAALGIVFVVRSEDRWKERRALSSLHRLRALVHVVDMHQLTKDPTTLSSGFAPTAHSPDRRMGAADMTRYLNYCSEILSICGKLAALYGQSLPQTGVLEAVHDIEELATALSSKIWQKINLTERKRGA
ncbi:MAG: hypothetical protein KDI98_01745 [Hyphomicrobiaceae bacterium]|nr:hypothetical protein [Hyphomicrobiaceae bacterium]